MDNMQITELSINEIKPDPTQPRKTFGKKNLKGLAQTLKKHGLIHPIEVDENNQIIVGERRWRAARFAGLERIPVIIQRNLSQTEKLERQL